MTTKQNRLAKSLNIDAYVPADELQYGGAHYKEMGIQPWTLMELVLTHEEFVGFLKGNIIKYSLRQGKKDSPDADKAKHYLQKLKEVQHGFNTRSKS